MNVPSTPPVENAEPKVILPESAPQKDESGAGTAAASVLVPAAASEGWGNLKGKFIYGGKPPEPVKLGDKVDKDLQCCGKYLSELVEEDLVVGTDGGLANVFVFVRTEGVKVNPDLEKKVAKAQMNHKHCRYEPHALAVWAGKQTVTFGNSDEINHAVAFNPLNPGNPAVNNTIAQNVSFDHVFQVEERVPVKVFCGIHKWEGGWILVRPNPYSAVSGDDGGFEISGLPTGKLEFQVWQEKAGYLAAKPDWKRGRFEMEIKAGDNDLGVIQVDPKLFEKK